MKSCKIFSCRLPVMYNILYHSFFLAGPSGDKRGAEEVEMWMHNYFDATVHKPVNFYQAAKGINFQVLRSFGKKRC